jgi:seryl-tRNA synthetase
LDRARRAAISQAEQLKAAANAASAEIGKLRRQGEDTAARQEEVRGLKQRIADLDESVKALDAEFRDVLAAIPNIPHESVPVGRDSEENVEVRRVGEPRKFDFEPKAHWDLGADLGILDLERAAKISGARFALYWGAGAKLERALINFMLDTHSREHGYTEVLPPFVVNSASLYGTGQLPKFAEDLFKLEKTDYWLIPTAEVPVTNLYRDETLPGDKLPISLCAYTPCFRSEAGAYGRDVRGIIRQSGLPTTRRIFCAASDCPSGPCFFAPAIWDSVPPRLTMWKSGCRDRTVSRRSRPARTTRHFRRAAPTSVSRARRGPNWFTR